MDERRREQRREACRRYRERNREALNKKARDRRAADPEHVRAIVRTSAQRRKEREPGYAAAYSKQVRQKPGHRERFRSAKNAAEAVRRAIKTGKLTRAKACEECGAEGVTEAAHHDYDRPLDVRWLCRRCHRCWDASDPKTRGSRLGN